MCCTAVLIDPATLHPSPAFGLRYEGAICQPRQTTSICDPLVDMDQVKINDSCQRHQTLTTGLIANDGKLIADVVHTGDQQCQQI